MAFEDVKRNAKRDIEMSIKEYLRGKKDKMRILELRKVLISLLFGCISSIILLLYLEAKYNFTSKQDLYSNVYTTQFPLIPVFLLQALFFSIVFLYASLLFQAKRENLKEGNRLKALEKIGMALQILLVFLTVSIFYFPILNNFFFMFSILLLCIGAILYYKTKSKLSVSIIIWGLAILFLTFLMIFLAYGIENCIISKHGG